MAITAADVKKLREATGVAMMDCKKALTEAEGDFEKAVALLREKGLAVAAKRADRTAAEGIIYFLQSDDKKTGVLVELNCETSFVAANDEFVAMAKDIADTVMAGDFADVEALKGATIASKGLTVADALNEIVAKIGEKIECSRFAKVVAGADESLTGYIHLDKLTGVIVKLKSDKADVVNSEGAITLEKDIAMHIAWSNPKYLQSSDVSKEEIDKETEIQIARLKQDPKMEGKPENILKGIVQGRLKKEFFAQLCLLEQPFVKDDKESVGALIDAFAKSNSAKVCVTEFVRFKVGEKA